MARSSDPKNPALWRDRFQRFLDSGLSVARFCAVEHVSESSFYCWQKKLGWQGQRRLARAKDRSFHAEDRNAGAEDRGTHAEYYDGVFRAVTVVPATCGVVVRLPGGTRIEVDADQLDAIRAVVAETVRVDRSRAAECHASSGNRNVSSGNRSLSSDN